MQREEFPDFEKEEVSEETKEPERGNRHSHGKGCTTHGLKWGVRFQRAQAISTSRGTSRWEWRLTWISVNFPDFTPYQIHTKGTSSMGHRKLAVLLGTGKNRVKRVMHTYGIAARRKHKKYVYPGKAAQIAPNLLRQETEAPAPEVIFSDIFEVRLADGSRVRGCFALRHRTRHIVGLAFDYHMRAELVTQVIKTMTFSVGADLLSFPSLSVSF